MSGMDGLLGTSTKTLEWMVSFADLHKVRQLRKQHSQAMTEAAMLGNGLESSHEVCLLVAPGPSLGMPSPLLVPAINK